MRAPHERTPAGARRHPLGSATPLVWAALGELVTEKAGVLNLGVEGMMLVGAVTAFAVVADSGSLALGVAAGLLAAGVALAALLAVLTQNLLTNQVATGLALSLFGVGLSAFVGRDYQSLVLDGVKGFVVPGRALRLDPFILGALALCLAVHGFLYSTHAGLILRAIGEAPTAAHAIGYLVLRVRWLAILFGGACSGFAGAYLAVDHTPMWVEA